MSSDPVTRLNAALEGRYRIESELGEGGMATVYLADDLKHERKVALKVLKPELAAVVGADRFLAEIKTTANLQHPHILPLFDSGEADSFLFYVMPFVEGESLRDRLDREGQLPVDEAVRIATDVADALQAAHERGVIHRDIKPANILLSRGRPLVADFGIALAVSAAGGGRLTETGLSLGTPFYMSPEQASADRLPAASSDVYSLGCVLYESLVGEPPFTGGSAQAVLAKILTGDAAAPTEMRPAIPRHVDAVIRKALERLPADRFPSAAAFGSSLADIGFRYGDESLSPSPGPRGVGRVHVAIASALVAGVMFPLGLWFGASSLRPQATGAAAVRFAIPVAGGYENTVSNEVPSLAISPDGLTVVYREDGRLMRRALESHDSEAILGTEGAEAPFFSPDGESLGFLQGDGFRRVSSNGVVTSVGSAVIDWVHGADWSEDGWIVYGRSFLGIWRISVEGGEPEPVTDPSLFGDERAHMWPQTLRGGTLLLFSAVGGSGKWHDSKIVLKDLETGERMTLVEGAAYGRYLPTGHLVYGTEDGTINARPFDLETREVGPSVPLESGVLLGQWGAGAAFAVSPTGTLAYVNGDNSRNHLLKWYGVNGEALGSIGGAMTVAWGLEIDPNGRRVAATLPNSRNDDIYLLEEGMVSPRPLTSHAASEGWPVWSPTGDRIAWQRDLDGTSGVVVRSVDDEAEDVVVYTGQGGVWPRSWSPDGRWLAISERIESGQDVIVVDMEDHSNVLTILDRPGEEWDPQFSRDGRFLAFDSNEAGPLQTYVVAFPAAGDPIRITTGESQHPRWSPTGDELYFWQDTTLMAARYRAEPSFTVESVRPLFTVPDYVVSDDPYYAVAPSGDRFLVQTHNPEAAINEVRVVLNWSTLVIERAGGSR